MSKRIVTLDDKYAQPTGRVFLTGIQALVRLPLDQKRLDRAQGLRTAGFISGYRGSPLGGYDQQLKRAARFLNDHEIVLWEGLNEDLGATAVWGSQQVGLFPGARFDGVFGLWYGKAPGVDRTGDVFKHANFAGSSRFGGVLAIAGDDHSCKSSTLPSQSEFAFQDAEMPVLSPSSVQEVLDFGLAGLAMSRASGLWVGMIALADTMDSAAVVDVGPERARFVMPPTLAELDLAIRASDKPMDKEARLRLAKLPAAQAFAHANGLDRVVLASPRPRFGVVAVGQAVRDVFEALDSLGLSLEQAADAGVSVFQVAMPWPLEPRAITAFCEGLERVLVVEHKRDLVEHQLKAALYPLPDARRPRIEGKRDQSGARLLSEIGSLSVPAIAQAIHDRLPPEARTDRAAAYFDRVRHALDAAARAHTDITRQPHFCSGCPHSTSTVTPAGSRALAGIGCHYMATFSGRADMTSQMGGEGVGWIGQQPFTDEPHIFVNLGDGTYSHSGSLAIRAAVTANVNITYKILFNGAVAMTGGQDVENELTVRDLVRQLKTEGVAKVVVVADDVSRHSHYELGAELYDRGQLDAVQRKLREIRGVTVLIYDQVCAAERRRKVKRGLAAPATRRAFINTAVCEGCGDCSIKSNCLSVEPLETEFGVKRQINQSSCNQDISCVTGFCPSFVTVEGAANARRAEPPQPPDLDNLPEPALPELARSGVGAPWSLIFTGVGGSGITTIAAILGMAAHIDGAAAVTLDMTGLAQKYGPVASHVRFACTPDAIRAGRTPAAGADALIAGDLVVAASAETVQLCDAARTRAVGNADVTPTAAFLTNRDLRNDQGLLRRRVERGVADFAAINAEALAERYLFDALYANMIMLGFAWGRGLVPVSRAAIAEAITLNGAAVQENQLAFDLGRVAALAPQRLANAGPKRVEVRQDLDTLIASRTALLTAYQNAAYAQRYAALVAAARARETALGLGERLTRAVAQNLAKLMAYKDEYEVARLYADGRFDQELKAVFGGEYALKVHLAPPLLAPRDPNTGLPRKIAMPRATLLAFKLLARLKGLRGTRFDVFGMTAERAMERRLRDTYEGKIRRLLATLTPDNHDLCVRIAEIPDQIRGFGHVKEASVRVAEEAEARLWIALAERSAQPAAIAAE